MATSIIKDAQRGNTSSQVSIQLASVSATLVVHKRGGVVEFNITLGNGTAFSSATGNDVVGSLPSGYRPPAELAFAGLVRTTGAWASANYTPIAARVSANGDISISGNATAIKAGQYISCAVVFHI